MKIKHCRNCSSKKLLNLFSLGNIFFTGKFLKKNNKARKGSIDVVMCDKCKLVQLKNNFDLNYMYGKDYGYRTGINTTMTKHVAGVVKKLSSMVKIKKNDYVLDIASNDGTLLNFYDKRVVTFGVDPLVNKYIKNYKKINFKISEFFSAKPVIKKVKNIKFKIITALSVFYDMKKPNKFLSDVKKILHNDGILLLEFADLGSIVKYNMFDTFCHEHLEYYSAKVISKMCEKNDLRLFDMKSNNINGGSIQFFICKKNSIYKNNISALNKIYRKETQLQLGERNTYFKFIKRVEKIKNKLNFFLNSEIKKGKIIHGYGASTKGNVLLQYFGLTNKSISHIAERNPDKYNLYTPGTQIKIISEKNSRNILPDYYLVLPWHFKDEILKREKQTIKKGSKFIFPLPDFVIKH